MTVAPPADGEVVFAGVRVFDGVSDALSEPTNVLVRGTTIAAVTSDEVSVRPDAVRVEGAGRTLMPGLIDAHFHVAFAALPQLALMTADVGYVALAAAASARDTLLRGFTSVRDAGGPTFGVKRAIDEGLVDGPRIWPSGAFISQTSGHGDFRLPGEVPRGIIGHHTHGEVVGAGVIADGVDEVLRAVREQLMLGASQIKMMAGGGISSSYDPIDVTEYTEAELRAAVDAAANWGTYVFVHAYTPRAVQQAIRAGVQCIDHGQLVDEQTVAMMAEHGTWWCLQPFLDDEDANPHHEPDKRAKQLQVSAGTARAYELSRKHGVNVAWGSDILFDARMAARQGSRLTKLARWFSPAEVLRMATSVNAELLAMSGPRNPYPGELGVVREGALADLLLVDGDPLQDIGLLNRPDECLAVIVKDGAVVKHALG